MLNDIVLPCFALMVVLTFGCGDSTDESGGSATESGSATGDGDGDPGDGDPGDGDGDPTGGACASPDCSQCYNCAEDDPSLCADEKAACEADADCLELFACVDNCLPPGDVEFGECHDGCVEGMPGEALFKALGGCLACDVCSCQTHPEC
jgi:hypothetical protein